MRSRGRSIALGIVIGVVGLVLLEWTQPYAASRSDYLPQIIVAYFLSVLFHEAGHASAAAAVGFRLVIFAVWPFQLKRLGTGWSIERMDKIRVGGFVFAVPPDTKDLRPRWYKMIAAGPLASLVCGVVAVLLYWTFGTRWPGVLAAQLECLAFWNLFFGILSLVPQKSRYATTDGARLRMLHRDDAEAQRFFNLTSLMGASHCGIRPREWPSAMVDMKVAPEDKTLEALAGLMMRYNWLIDFGRFQEAGDTLLEVLVRDVPEPRKANWELERAWFSARLNEDLMTAKDWLAKGTRRDTSPSYLCALHKAQAAIALLDHRPDDAQAHAVEAIKLSKKISDLGIATAIRDRLESLLDDLKSVQAA